MRAKINIFINRIEFYGSDIKVNLREKMKNVIFSEDY